jgi:hypothetical protein
VRYCHDSSGVYSPYTQEPYPIRLQGSVRLCWRVRILIATWFVRLAFGRRYGVDAAWLVASRLGHDPMHSLAESLSTGQIIYHDRRNDVLRNHPKPLSRRRAVTIARHWLVELGWPGHRMPLEGVSGVPDWGPARQVTFGWAGVGRAAIPAATLWVTPDGSMIEASVWPQVAGSGTIPARSVATA